MNEQQDTITPADGSKLKKAHSRWNQCQGYLQENKPSKSSPRVLDCGCGAGHFVLEGLGRGIDIWGIDQRPSKIKRYHRLLRCCGSPANWGQRCLAASGTMLPFADNQFDLVCSWWVLEHVANPSRLMVEMVRVVKSGGLLLIRAQDARSCWEGHYKIPWLPYLASPLKEVWLEVFGKDPQLYDDLTELTQPQIIAIAQSLNCAIRRKAPTPAPSIHPIAQLATASQVAEAAREIKKKWEEGSWQPNPEGLYLVAEKL